VGYSHGKRWTDEDVERELRHIVATTGMVPTAQRLGAAGRQDLSNQIGRRGGFAHWRNKIGLPENDSESAMGHRWETHVAELLEATGHAAERQTARAPFDILVDDCVRVNVKSAHWGAYGRDNYCKGHFFGIGKTWASCDVFALVAVTDDEPPRVMWVPWHEARQQTITLTKSHRFNGYTNIGIVRDAANSPLVKRTG
jgi:hypothetical protein